MPEASCSLSNEAMRAQEIHRRELWLPVEFFNDDFFIEDNRAVAVQGELLRPSFASCTLRSSQPDSATETKTDEEDYIAGLTSRMAHTFLFKGNGVSVSSVKVLAPMETSSKSTVLEGGMRKGPSQVCSPPSTSLVQREKQIERESYGRSIVSQLKKPSAPAKPTVAGFSQDPIFTHQQLQAEQFYRLKQQIEAAWSRQSKATTSGGSKGAVGLTLPVRSSLHLRQHPVTGMKAVLSDISDARRPSAGTGVFLPKRVGFLNESHEKRACSSVLPARIFQTLNLNQEDLGFQPRSPGSSVLDYELALAPQKRHQKDDYLYHTPASPSPPPPPPPAVTSHEIRLPTEWTY